MDGGPLNEVKIFEKEYKVTPAVVYLSKKITGGFIFTEYFSSVNGDSATRLSVLQLNPESLN